MHKDSVSFGDWSSVLRFFSWMVIFSSTVLSGTELKLNDQEYFTTQGLSVLVHQNAFHGVFYDQKLSGIEIIQHEERIATNGDIRLSPTPEQWDPVPHFKERKRTRGGNGVVVYSGYPDLKFTYRIEVTSEREGFIVAVHLDEPLPPALVGRAGFNLEFLPSSYFGKSYVLDTGTGIFPRHPNGRMKKDADGNAQPLPIASGRRIVLSPEDPMTRTTISSEHGPLMLFDGRNRAQNGWFVVRTLIPGDRTENAIVWRVRPNVVEGWMRPPVVAYNQVGYTPERSKIATIELDPAFKAPPTASVVQLMENGEVRNVLTAPVKVWGRWLRYSYAHFDFSVVRTPGVYAIDFAGKRTTPFRISEDVYRTGVWEASLDTFLPVQMDHVKVREGYRIWHGVSHLDDARQAPVNYTHFDGYSMGANKDSRFEVGEHIPGLDIGGWYDAGDFDIRTQTQTKAVIDLVLARELFGLDWDQTTVNQKARSVEIRRPDGVPDVLQQVEHGVLQLLAQYKVFGHAIPGIVEPTLEQYTHLGDGASKTDGKIYSAKLQRIESDGVYSGLDDDRWAFTTHTTGLNYGTAAALAAASRVLQGTNPQLANECLQAAIAIWRDEHKHPPIVFNSFNTTGGDPFDEEIRATVELLVTTKAPEYSERILELMPEIRKRFDRSGWVVVRVLQHMDEKVRNEVEDLVRASKAKMDAELAKNPYGVPITNATWGGVGMVVGFGSRMYLLHKAFPEVIGADYTLRAFDYVLGRHPASNVSYVSSVGTDSKLIAYGSNRADYSFIPGGVIPGIVIVRPDFPELKDKWPFLWFENEYVIDAATSFVFHANAVDQLTKK